MKAEPLPGSDGEISDSLHEPGRLRKIGRRFIHWVDQKNSKGYYQHVPAPIRELGESRGIPRPVRYIPSAHGVPLGVPKLLELIEDARKDLAAQAQSEQDT